MRHGNAHRKLGRTTSTASRCSATWRRRCQARADHDHLPKAREIPPLCREAGDAGEDRRPLEPPTRARPAAGRRPAGQAVRHDRGPLRRPSRRLYPHRQGGHPPLRRDTDGDRRVRRPRRRRQGSGQWSPTRTTWSPPRIRRGDRRATWASAAALARRLSQLSRDRDAVDGQRCLRPPSTTRSITAGSTRR